MPSSIHSFITWFTQAVTKPKKQNCYPTELLLPFFTSVHSLAPKYFIFSRFWCYQICETSIKFGETMWKSTFTYRLCWLPETFSFIVPSFYYIASFHTVGSLSKRLWRESTRPQFTRMQKPSFKSHCKRNFSSVRLLKIIPHLQSRLSWINELMKT